MTEVERRKVHVVKGGSLTGQKVHIKPIDVGFELTTDTGQRIATSLSDHSLSNWAERHGVQEIVQNYDLGLGDDAR